MPPWPIRIVHWIGVFTCTYALVLFGILKATMGIRVSPDEEAEGLDVGEHGNVAYGSGQLFSAGGLPSIAASSHSSAMGEPVPRLRTEDA